MPKNATVVKPTRPAKSYWIGFDLGGTKMMACVMDDQYKILSIAKKSTQGYQGATKGTARIKATIDEALATAGIKRDQIKGIGMGCPGTVNAEKGILIHAPNLGWDRIPLGPRLSATFKCPVAILNDVDAGTYAEYSLGAGKGSRSLLGVFPGTGLGAGFVYAGNLIQGKNVSCMELGNIWLPGTHLNSTMPGVALLEDLTSRLGIAAAASVECYRGKAPILDGKTNASLREMKSKALTSSFKARETTVNVFNNSVHYLGMGIAMVVNLLGPDQITLGGGLVEEMPRYYLDQVRSQVERYAIPEIFRGIKFSVAKLGDKAVAVGSVAWLRKVNA